jgi:hypothetical protein
MSGSEMPSLSLGGQRRVVYLPHGSMQSALIMSKDTSRAAEGRTPPTLFPASIRQSTIRAFHGSPHVVDKFDLSKAGTGEGVQSYGWGLYFAEEKDVAETYRKAGEAAFEIDGKSLAERKRFTNLPEDARCEVEDILKLEYEQGGGDLSKIKSRLFGLAATVKGNFATAYKLVRDAKSISVPPGHIYEVAISAAPDEFLDWDKSLKDQSPSLQAAIAVVLPFAEERITARHGWGDVEDPTAGPVWSAPGAALCETLSEGTARNPKLAKEYQRLETAGLMKPNASDPEKASILLALNGIAGIRYLDRGSRMKGEGSRNLVVFSEARVTPVAVNGQAVSRHLTFGFDDDLNSGGKASQLARARDSLRGIQQGGVNGIG